MGKFGVRERKGSGEYLLEFDLLWSIEWIDSVQWFLRYPGWSSFIINRCEHFFLESMYTRVWVPACLYLDVVAVVSELIGFQSKLRMKIIFTYHRFPIHIIKINIFFNYVQTKFGMFQKLLYFCICLAFCVIFTKVNVNGKISFYMIWKGVFEPELFRIEIWTEINLIIIVYFCEGFIWNASYSKIRDFAFTPIQKFICILRIILLPYFCLENEKLLNFVIVYLGIIPCPWIYINTLIFEVLHIIEWNS